MKTMNDLMIGGGQSRRDFLKALIAASAAAMAGSEPRLMGAEGVVQPKPTADACILPWMGGCMAGADRRVGCGGA